MRVIAGTLGGRNFKSPSGHATHPMSDKMRGALFNSLGDITGLTVLDPFAGSGAIGFEAASRGAASVVLIDRDRQAQQTIRENIESLAIGHKVQLVTANANSWLRNTRENYDIIILDPPYNKPQWELLERLGRRLNPEGRLVVSWPTNQEAPRLRGFELRRHKQYGDANLYYYDSISL